MIRTNKNKVVKISVQGELQHPGKTQDFIVGVDGNVHVLPATGGICYNVKVGDCCMDLAGDHIEPGVSTSNTINDFKRNGYSVYSCIGNEAKIITGDAKGSIGYVTGEHDLCNVLIYFDDEILQKLTLNDQVIVKGFGQGFKLLDYPDVHILNLDPDLFEKLGIEEKNGKLIVPVAKRIPSCLLGAGLGGPSAYKGDIDIMTQDEVTVKKYSLEDLRFGDIVLLEDYDSRFGKTYVEGATTIGVVSHGNCYKPGHGPGITSIISTKLPLIETKLDKNANIANYHPLTKDNFGTK